MPTIPRILGRALARRNSTQTPQLSSIQLNSTLSNSTLSNSTQLYPTQLYPTQLCSTQLYPTRLCSTQLNSIQLNSVQLNSCRTRAFEYIRSLLPYAHLRTRLCTPPLHTSTCDLYLVAEFVERRRRRIEPRDKLRCGVLLAAVEVATLRHVAPFRWDGSEGEWLVSLILVLPR